MPINESDLDFLVGIARERAQNDRRYNSTTGLDSVGPRQKRTHAPLPPKPGAMHVAPTIDASTLTAFLVKLGRRHPRRVRRLLRDVEWLRKHLEREVM